MYGRGFVAAHLEKISGTGTVGSAKSDYHGNRRFQGVLAGHAGSGETIVGRCYLPRIRTRKLIIGH